MLMKKNREQWENVDLEFSTQALSARHGAVCVLRQKRDVTKASGHG